MARFQARQKGPLVEVSVELPLTLIKEGEVYVAYTPALDLSTCGDTEAEAKKMFGESVRAFFNDLMENDSFEDVLPGLGWTKERTSPVQSTWVPPKISQESFGVRVPLAA